jgi:AraC-like DNA-binding protein
MHADAAHLWTVPELAAASGLSRAAFARSFQQALDQPPMQYLTDWRMTIAARTGYASPYAFAAAFRRHHGQPPGQWRQRELDRPDINPAAPADDIHTR